MKSILAAAMLVAGVSVVFGTGQQPPRPDPQLSPTGGTGSVSGVVVNDEERPQAVRRAIVTLTGDGLRPSRGAITDDEGRFAFGGLPPGRFNLTVSRASFVTSMYGAKRPGRQGTPVTVTDGARVTDLVVRIWRGAAVAGVLRDDTGAPVANIEVRAVPARTTTSLLTLSNNGALTNELGEFRLFGLEPGTYVVVARPPAGGASRILAMSEAEVDAALADLKRRPVASASPSSPNAAAQPASPPSFDFAPIYYPGTAVLAQAAPISLVAGQEQLGLDFAIQRIPTAVVEGTVTRPDGTPASGASLQMTATAPPGPFTSGLPLVVNATAGGDGTFRIAQVTPGAYQLVARGSISQPPPPPPPAGGGRVTPGLSGPPLWAVADLAVAGTDIRGVNLTLDAGTTVVGTIAFESDVLKPPADLTRIRIQLVDPVLLTLKPGTVLTSIRFVPGSNVRADGTFEITNMPPGVYRLLINGPGVDGTAWWARSAIAADRDLLDRDVEIGRGSGRMAVQVTFSDRRSELSGTLQTTAGAAASDVFVIAFAADRQYWGAGARRIQAVRPGVDGRFVMKDLPAGDYLLAAVTDIDQDEWTDPAFLEQLMAASVIKLSIATGEKRVQDLRIGR